MSTIIMGDIAEGSKWWSFADFQKRELARLYKQNNAFMQTWKFPTADVKVHAIMRNGYPVAFIYVGGHGFIFRINDTVPYAAQDFLASTDLKGITAKAVKSLLRVGALNWVGKTNVVSWASSTASSRYAAPTPPPGGFIKNEVYVDGKLFNIGDPIEARLILGVAYKKNNLLLFSRLYGEPILTWKFISPDGSIVTTGTIPNIYETQQVICVNGSATEAVTLAYTDNGAKQVVLRLSISDTSVTEVSRNPNMGSTIVTNSETNTLSGGQLQSVFPDAGGGTLFWQAGDSGVVTKSKDTLIAANGVVIAIDYKKDAETKITVDIQDHSVLSDISTYTASNAFGPVDMGGYYDIQGDQTSTVVFTYSNVRDATYTYKRDGAEIETVASNSSIVLTGSSTEYGNGPYNYDNSPQWDNGSLDELMEVVVSGSSKNLVFGVSDLRSNIFSTIEYTNTQTGASQATHSKTWEFLGGPAGNTDVYTPDQPSFIYARNGGCNNVDFGATSHVELKHGVGAMTILDAVSPPSNGSVALPSRSNVSYTPLGPVVTDSIVSYTFNGAITSLVSDFHHNVLITTEPGVTDPMLAFNREGDYLQSATDLANEVMAGHTYATDALFTFSGGL